MKSFEMTCLRLYSLLLIMIGLPIVMMVMAGFILVRFINLPGWIIIVAMILLVSSICYLVFYSIKKVSNLPCTVTLDDKGIKIVLQRGSLFFPGKIFESQWAAIRAASSSYSPQKQCRFYKIAFNEPYISIYIDSREKLSTPYEETEFGKLLMGYVNRHNKVLAVEPAVASTIASTIEPALPINTKNFYQGTWARIITWLVWIFLAGCILIKIIYPDSVNNWRIAQFAIASGIWLLAYQTNNRKKN